MPLFSIVIPTRNRSHLLRYALRSALSQTFDDFEVIVSDNYSSDETEDIVNQASGHNGKVRYFKTGRVLSMPDSWEIALSKADGEWVTILCDDDVLCPGLMNRIHSIMEKTECEVFVWPIAAYFDREYSISRLRNHLLFRPHTSHVSEVRTNHALANLCRFQSHTNLPRMLNSFCHRNLITRVRESIGRFFLPPAPDYTSCAAILNSIRKYSFVDIPARISGVTKDSIGRSFKENRDEASRRFLSEFGGDLIFAHTPLQNLTQTNCIAESILMVKEALNGKSMEFDVQWHRYYSRCFHELFYSKTKGADVSKEIKELFCSLKREPASLQAKSLHQLIVGCFQSEFVRQYLRAMVERVPILKDIASLALNRRLVHGEKAGFHNILEAALYLEKND